MCGIVGYIGKKDISPILIKGLKKLEYRGYDSAGLCVSSGGHLKTAKEKGRVADLAEQIKNQDFSGTLGIGHTRWATHGEPNQINAHPHLDCQDSIAIVHNGIIENHSSLKTMLKQEGHVFKSDTDSEVISHLVEKFYKNDLSQAVRRASALLEGAFGIAVIHKNEEKIVVARQGSPLIIGLGQGEMFVASDVPAILEHTKKVIYLNDGEMATITKDGYAITSLSGEKIDREAEEIKWSLGQIEKKGYKHFMLKEIMEQPEALANTLRGRIKNGQIKLTLNFDPQKIKRIIISACGTSWHSGLIGKYLLESLAAVPTEVDYASEFRYREPLIKEGDLAILISQSGETADTLAALREAKKGGAQTLGIINVVGSTIAREVEGGIFLHVGPEIGVASTKAFTAQVVALLLLSFYIRQNKGLAIDRDLIRQLAEIPAQIDEALHQSDNIKKIAEKFKDSKNFLYLGRGLNFPVALEGALKLKEISYIHAEGYPAAEIKHGPIALIDAQMPVVFIATKNNLSDKIISNMQEVKARAGVIIAVANEDEGPVAKLADYIIKVPEVNDKLSPLINVVPLQLLAYHIADLKGLDVDKPRNLAKSVTVE